jgi:hypothetical protein
MKKKKQKHQYSEHIQELLYSDDQEMRQLGLTLLGFNGDNYQECLHLFEKYSVHVYEGIMSFVNSERTFEVHKKTPPTYSMWADVDYHKDIAHENDFKNRKKFHSR